ncbi:MAG: exodeoxyribonuclease III [Patescibacteria group bacterium]|nr:exodeoxyribonuclease III [Patescibacteria group bacterium]
MSELNLLSWNVNGLRAIVKKGFVDFLKKQNPDFLCLQEIKISDSARAQVVFDFSAYQEFFNSAQRPGYSGTAVLVKEGLKVKALPAFSWDDEGRVQVLDIGKYYLVNVYFPNAKDDLSRLHWKIKWNDRLLLALKKLEKVKPLLICGDYNVAHQEIDLARPKENTKSAGFTIEERTWLNKFLAQGMIDTFRFLHPQKVQYSWWSFRSAARARNVGWRIDYWCVSQKLKKNIRQAYILDKVMGSDHAPVGLRIK